MALLRVVTHVATSRTDLARSSYGGMLEMTVAMDPGRIVTSKGSGSAPPQISFATERGSGTPVTDLSVEVDDLDAVLERPIAGGVLPEHGPVADPWGVRRSFVRDPFGRLLEILAHERGLG